MILNSLEVRVGGDNTESVKIGRDVRQGCCFSSVYSTCEWLIKGTWKIFHKLSNSRRNQPNREIWGRPGSSSERITRNNDETGCALKRG